VKKRSLIETAGERVAPERMAAQLELLAGVASKALDMGNGEAAERILATAVSDFVDLARRAATEEEWEAVARMHAVLVPLLPRLEAATGKGWTACLDVVKDQRWRPRLPPRGQA
jgi:hypothetical protein